MKTSIEIVKAFYKKDGQRITIKQGEWLRNVYYKENKTDTRGNKPILIFENGLTHYRLNVDNSLFLINK